MDPVFPFMKSVQGIYRQISQFRETFFAFLSDFFSAVQVGVRKRDASGIFDCRKKRHSAGSTPSWGEVFFITPTSFAVAWGKCGSALNGI
jgi:hypothetical protein